MRVIAAILLALLPTTVMAESGRRVMPDIVSGIQPAPYQTYPTNISGVCSFDLKPEFPVIIGGVVVGGIKPTDTQAELDKLLAAIREYVAGIGAELKTGELVRAAQDPRAQAQGQPFKPFSLMQKIEVKVTNSKTVDLNLALDELMKRGMNRFGYAANLTSWNSTPSIVVLYRALALQEKTSAAAQGCVKEAFDAWCKGAGEQHQTCHVNREAAYRELSLSEYYFTSSNRVTNSDGYTQQVSFSRSNMPEVLELSSDETVKFNGTLTIQVPSHVAE